MSAEKIETLVVGAGQAGLAMSAHLTRKGLPHLVLERNRIAERWRSERWDSLVANGPAWHDRFPDLKFDVPPESFATRDQVVTYFETYARQNAAPVRCGVEVRNVERDGSRFKVETSQGTFIANNVVAATGPFQRPLIPTLVPKEIVEIQLHSSAYRNPGQLPEGAVLVVGAGSSGSQIADELQRAGKQVYLSVGPHNRPPRAYRGHDYCWWLGVLGEWDAKTREPGMEHVTISVSGAYGGHTVDFRKLAERGITLIGRVGALENGALTIADDLASNIARGDANYLSVLDRADEYAKREHLNLSEEPEARIIGPDPECLRNPLRTLNLAAHGITSIIWATGYALDFSWLKLDVFDAQGRPAHHRGVAEIPGLYFLGLAWLSRRASPFIWGVWHDAAYLAEHISAKSKS